MQTTGDICLSGMNETLRVQNNGHNIILNGINANVWVGNNQGQIIINGIGNKVHIEGGQGGVVNTGIDNKIKRGQGNARSSNRQGGQSTANQQNVPRGPRRPQPTRNANPNLNINVNGQNLNQNSAPFTPNNISNHYSFTNGNSSFHMEMNSGGGFQPMGDFGQMMAGLATQIQRQAQGGQRFFQGTGQLIGGSQQTQQQAQPSQQPSRHRRRRGQQGRHQNAGGQRQTNHRRNHQQSPWEYYDSDSDFSESSDMDDFSDSDSDSDELTDSESFDSNTIENDFSFEFSEDSNGSLNQGNVLRTTNGQNLTQRTNQNSQNTSNQNRPLPSRPRNSSSRGVDIEVISVKRNEKPIKETCVICTEQLDKSDPETAFLGCGHWFHFACIGKWLEIKNKCPQCIMPVKEVFKNDG